MRALLTYSIVILIGMGWLYLVVGFTSNEVGAAVPPAVYEGAAMQSVRAALVTPEREPVDVQDEGERLDLDEHGQTLRERSLNRQEVRELIQHVAPDEPIGGITPYERWLLGTDLADTTVEQRNQVRWMLEEIPIQLRPGEAEWIIERAALDDWKLHGETRDVAFITFLGPKRVLQEASPELLAQLRADFDESDWSYLFGSPKPSK